MDDTLPTAEDLRPFPLRQSLGFLLTRTALKLRLLGNVILQEAGEDITVDQWGILNLLWEADGQTPVELARRADKDKLLGLGVVCFERACQGLSRQEVETLKSLLNRVYANVS
jgi:MarR family transcriptional regulator for hemolysin